MVSLAALWLPILLSAVIVFVASSIIHMVLPYHRSEYHQLPDEDNLLATLRAAGLKRGFYNFPFCTHKDMKSPAVIEKFKQGPVGFITVYPQWPAQHGQVPRAVVWLLPGDRFLRRVSHRAHSHIPALTISAVFRVVGTAAFLAYGLGNLSNSIWKGQPWSMTIKESFDGLVYALLTAGTFGWLWPR